MAYNKFTWGKPSEAAPVVPLVPPIDPEHLNPHDNIDVAAGNPLWVSNSVAPTFSDSLYGDLGGGPIGGGGPIDMTPGQTAGAAPDPIGIPPTRSEFGVGVGPGLTTLQAQAVRGALMSEDHGAVAAHQVLPMTQRYDGSGPHVEIIPDDTIATDSPQTLQLDRTGVGQPNDPYARSASRQKRWWDRFIDMHRWGVEYRPLTLRNAYTAQAQPPVPGGTQYDSPYPTSATAYYDMQSPDSFVAPQDRRTPVNWAQPITTDGISGPVNDAGLTTWGL